MKSERSSPLSTLPSPPLPDNTFASWLAEQARVYDRFRRDSRAKGLADHLRDLAGLAVFTRSSNFFELSHRVEVLEIRPDSPAVAPHRPTAAEVPDVIPFRPVPED
jgi:hypothetical protein